MKGTNSLVTEAAMHRHRTAATQQRCDKRQGRYRHPRKIVKEVLRQVDMTTHCSKSFGKLSGGQKRRISTGVAILNCSDLLLLDEPTAGIDPKLFQFRGKGLEGGENGR
ncbi:hypothetical protein TELCIR_02918 [Teladorsagia circumcincta]|uniref:ABC transporter domain-containing protein n=1 Tax=Teladorsagia circumcincta TaxID=45464 RepID=A0A2G9UZW7_TELCI|nr:hypothetical protein TELCIR_02918 [Teladorsagia circumcincta]